MISPAPRRLRAALVRAFLAACFALTACGSRTGLNDESYVPDLLACQTTPFRARPGVALRLYATLPVAARGRAVWRVVDGPAGAPAPTLTSTGTNEANFFSNVEGTWEVELAVPSDVDDDAGADAGAPRSCRMRVVVRASGPVALCPAEVTTAPLQRVAIPATAQGDRRIESYRWTLETAPLTSARPAPSPDDTVATAYTPDVVGDYRLRLEVTDAAGEVDACATIVHAVPREGLRVELVWDPPGRSCPRNAGAACDGSDVDLHLLRAPGTGTVWRSDNDCYWFNCNASASRTLAWGAAGAADDPRLDIDDVTGHGPENVNITRPGTGPYRIGVHYFDAHGAGPQSATVVVYCGSSTPAARLGPVVLSYRGSADASDFWLVADVIPAAAGGCEVRPLSRAGLPWIVTYDDAQRGAGTGAP